MKPPSLFSRAVSALAFDAGRISFTVDRPASSFRMRERQESEFVLTPEQGRALADALEAWLEVEGQPR